MARQWSSTCSHSRRLARRRVEGQGLVVEGERGEERDDLLRELVGTVVVAAVGDGDGETVGLVVRAHGVVRARLGRVVGRARPVGRVLGEPLVAVEREVAVHLARRHVMEAGRADEAGRLEQGLRPHHVGPEEAAGVDDGEAVVALRREVHDRVDVVLLERGGGGDRVGDVGVDEHERGCRGPPGCVGRRRTSGRRRPRRRGRRPRRGARSSTR